MATDCIVRDVNSDQILASSGQDLPPSRRLKFAPDPFISEGANGEIIFAEAAMTASARLREQARLLYARGILETRLVAAMWRRDVKEQYSDEEISKAQEIAYGQAGVLREEERICKAIVREERRTDPDPFELDRLEARLHALRPFTEELRAKIRSVGEHVLGLVKVLERIKKLDRRARGWKLKGERQVACALFGSLYESTKCGGSAYRPFRCHNRYCPYCAPGRHDGLVKKYLRLEAPINEFLAAHPSYRLRVLDITAIKRGEQMPTREDVSKFKDDVKKLRDRINRRVAEKLGVPCSKQLTGYLYCLEFGFDNNNLHCHGALLSPYLEQDWLSAQWRKIRDDGSFRVWIEDGWSFKAVILHALEYAGKFGAPDAERGFALELAFAGSRRVDGLGWFHNRLPKEDEESCDLHCFCGDPECFLKLNREVGWLPVSWFEERGIRSLDEVRDRGSPHPSKVDTSWVN